MNIKDGYISKKVTFDTQDNLDEMIDRLTSMMSKLTAHNDDQNKQFKPEIDQRKRRGWKRNFYDQNYWLKKLSKTDIGQIVEVGEYHSVVEHNMDRIIETDQGII